MSHQNIEIIALIAGKRKGYTCKTSAMYAIFFADSYFWVILWRRRGCFFARYLHNSQKTVILNYRWEYISCESDSKDNTSIVMIRDSFADNIFDYMSTRFSKTSYIIANGDSYSISNIIKTNPNIVIYLSVERYFKHRILYEYMILFNR